MDGIGGIKQRNEHAANIAHIHRDRHIANAQEWLRRSHVSLADGNVDVARCQSEQATDELKLAGIYKGQGVSVAARAVA